MNSETVITHCGKLGDFIMALPVISWISKNMSNDIHLVLPGTFPPFTQIESLVALQPMIKKFSLVSYTPTNYDCGGQPYHFNPNDFGVPCNNYFNLGFLFNPGAKNIHCSNAIAQEHKLGVDWDFVLNLGEVETTEDIVFAEQHIQSRFQNIPNARVLDLNLSILDNARIMKAAKVRHCYQSGMLHILDWADVGPIQVHRWKNQSDLKFYAKDMSHFTMYEELG